MIQSAGFCYCCCCQCCFLKILWLFSVVVHIGAGPWQFLCEWKPALSLHVLFMSMTDQFRGNKVTKQEWLINYQGFTPVFSFPFLECVWEKEKCITISLHRAKDTKPSKCITGFSQRQRTSLIIKLPLNSTLCHHLCCEI